MRETAARLLLLVGLGWPQIVMSDAKTPESGQGTWALVSIAGETYAAQAEIDLTVPGRISGQAPCNNFSGRWAGDWPVVGFGPFRSTKRACEALALEHRFLAMLRGMTRAEMRMGGLVLSDENGVEMVFSPMSSP
jgi:heat shock protein HslJ